MGVLYHRFDRTLCVPCILPCVCLRGIKASSLCHKCFFVEAPLRISWLSAPIAGIIGDAPPALGGVCAVTFVQLSSCRSFLQLLFNKASIVTRRDNSGLRFRCKRLRSLIFALALVLITNAPFFQFKLAIRADAPNVIAHSAMRVAVSAGS